MSGTIRSRPAHPNDEMRRLWRVSERAAELLSALEGSELDTKHHRGSVEALYQRAAEQIGNLEKSRESMSQ